jgi:hypothetical protein
MYMSLVKHSHVCGILECTENVKVPVSFKAPNNVVKGNTPTL